MEIEKLDNGQFTLLIPFEDSGFKLKYKKQENNKDTVLSLYVECHVNFRKYKDSMIVLIKDARNNGIIKDECITETLDDGLNGVKNKLSKQESFCVDFIDDTINLYFQLDLLECDSTRQILLKKLSNVDGHGIVIKKEYAKDILIAILEVIVRKTKCIYDLKRCLNL